MPRTLFLSLFGRGSLDAVELRGLGQLPALRASARLHQFSRCRCDARTLPIFSVLRFETESRTFAKLHDKGTIRLVPKGVILRDDWRIPRAR